MNVLNELFKTSKPIIAMLHLPALPGDPAFSSTDDMGKIVNKVRIDLNNLQDGGVDAIIFSNEFSFPYQNNVSTSVIASMAYIIGSLRDEINVPFGVDVISDSHASVELAAAVGATFIRSLFTGVYAGDAGIQTTDIARLFRRKKELGLEKLKMLYFVTAESDVYINDRSVESIAKSVAFKCHPDVFVVSGSSAGEDASTQEIQSIKNVVPNIPVLCNTGCTYENITEKLSSCDGAVVGTYFKKNGEFTEDVDKSRVKKLMDKVRQYRG